MSKKYYMKKNYSLYGLPEKIEYCKKCVISNQRPNSAVEYRNISNLLSLHY